MCAVPRMAIVCSSTREWLPGKLFKHFLSDRVKRYHLHLDISHLLLLLVISGIVIVVAIA